MESNSPEPRPEPPAERRTGPVDDAAVRLAELPDDQAQMARLDPHRHRPAGAGRRAGAGDPGPTPDLKVACAVYAVTGCPAVRRQRRLPPRQLVPAGQDRPEAAGPHEHHAGDRRQLHAAGLGPAGPAQGRAAAVGDLVRGHPRRGCSGCCGPTPRGGSTCRSTSPWAAARCSTCRTSSPPMSPAAVLICVGGVLYITGAVFYALKKPNFSYQHFGFHELFHALTVVAFVRTTSPSPSRCLAPPADRPPRASRASPALVSCRAELGQQGSGRRHRAAAHHPAADKASASVRRAGLPQRRGASSRPAPLRDGRRPARAAAGARRGISAVAPPAVR